MGVVQGCWQVDNSFYLHTTMDGATREAERDDTVVTLTREGAGAFKRPHGCYQEQQGDRTRLRKGKDRGYA